MIKQKSHLLSKNLDELSTLNTGFNLLLLLLIVIYPINCFFLNPDFIFVIKLKKLQPEPKVLNQLLQMLVPELPLYQLLQNSLKTRLE